MKVSIIIAVYKDIEVLELLLESLAYQTYKNFEVVVAEDANSKEMKYFIENTKKKYSFGVKHTFQEDHGVRKARSQNNAILASSGEYLIFIDGDCVPYSNFIEGHVYISEKNTALTGRRVNIPMQMVPNIRKGIISLYNIEKNFWKYSMWMFHKQIRYRQGIYINPKGLIYKIVSKRKASVSILGCNFSCFKKDMITLNGFDESYGETAIPDDMDWEWRFQSFGMKLKSCKNIANMFHLDHKIHDRGDATPFLQIMDDRRKANKYICDIGLNTHNA